MRRMAAFITFIVILIILTGLSHTAMDPAHFSGDWYSSHNQNLYLFQEGIIYCAKYPITLSDDYYISGAYTYCADSIVLYAAGIKGLESEKELFFIRKDHVSILCENKDGTGEIYFIRYQN